MAENETKSELEVWIDENQAILNEFRAKYGEISVIQSAWGGFYVFRKPGFHDILKYNAESVHSDSPVTKAWAPIKLVEQVLLYPSKVEFTKLRDQYGYEFVDSLHLDMRVSFGPKGNADAKKL